MNRGLKFLRNRYVATLLLGLGWVSFVTDIDLFFIWRSQQELQDLRKQELHLKASISDVQEDLTRLTSQVRNLEHLARERYFMKRPDEDIFRMIPVVRNQE